jgi:hypothetical protein
MPQPYGMPMGPRACHFPGGPVPTASQQVPYGVRRMDDFTSCAGRRSCKRQTGSAVQPFNAFADLSCRDSIAHPPLS